MCTCLQDIDTTTHFLFHWKENCERKTLFHKINEINENILGQSDSAVTKILLVGVNKLDFETSKTLLMSKSRLFY